MNWRGIPQSDKLTNGRTSRLLFFSSILTMCFLLVDGGFEVFGNSKSLDQVSQLEADEPKPTKAARSSGEQNDPSKRGNPLWEISLSALTATRERPVFSSSRRPPAPPAVATVYVAPPPKPAPASEPDHPLLSLVGTVAGDTGQIGIFVDDAKGNILRLRIGQDFGGWTLRAIKGRSAEFNKAGLTATLGLPARTASQSAPPLRLPVTPGSDVNRKSADGPMIATSPQQAYLPLGQAIGSDPWMGPMKR